MAAETHNLKTEWHRRHWLLTCTALGAGLPWLQGCAQTGTPAPPAAPPAPLSPLQIPHLLPEPTHPHLPSVVLVGDSTVRNGQGDGQGLGPVGQWGWGQVLGRLLGAAQVNVVNRAIGGLSSRTYRTGGHWGRTRAFIKRGDLVLMQFGHNDSSAINDASRARGSIRGTGAEQQTIQNQLTGQPETVFSFGAYLRGYIADIRALGATPVLCTPVPRKRRDAESRTLRGTGSYATWAATVAREEGVALIDLDTLVSERYDTSGPTVVDMLFPRKTSEAAPEERVHTNWAGAALNAHLVRDQLAQQRLLPEAAFLPLLADPPAPTAPSAVAAPALNSTLNSRLPTLFLVGDSTVRSAGQGGHWGWGERLNPWLDPQHLQLANHAIGGRSTRTFLREGRWQAVRSQLKPGDVVLIQFGHNDGGRVGDPAAKQRGVLPGWGAETATETLPDGRVETVRSFGAYLTQYLRQALDAGAVPVVLSPVPHKDRWQAEAMKGGRDFEEFAHWGLTVAQREGALFIDLTLIVTQAYRALGAAGVEGLFSDARTHTNDAGARLNAACVAQGLRQLPQALLLPGVLVGLRAESETPAAKPA